jgi:hypothetical protein
MSGSTGLKIRKYTLVAGKVVAKKMLIARKEKFWIESRERGGSAAEERRWKAEEKCWAWRCLDS